MKKIRFIFIYIVYLIAVLILIDYIFYRFYIKRIINNSNVLVKDAPLWEVKNIDSLTMLRLGAVNTDKKSCFVNFDTRKKDGYIRVGCFGDSFTYGEEVSNIYDYPSFLQDIFIKNGASNIEVINFGSGWHGFTQQFLMWKYVGKKYNLDYILIGPGCFQTNRDTAFNHTKGRNIYYLHSRFIVKNSKLQLLDPVGVTSGERFRNYYSFITPLRYIRFDINSPPFLACLFLPERQLIKNPFYYHTNIPKEASDIHRLLLSEMADCGKKIFVGHDWKYVINLVKKLNNKNIDAALFYSPIHFPYMRPRSHYSALGNKIVAQQMFDLLMGNRTSEFDLLETRDIETSIPGNVEIDKKSLNEYVDLKIEINNTVVGCFVIKGQDDVLKKKQESIIKKYNAVSLLAIKARNQSIMDALFVPLDFLVTENMPLGIRISSGGKSEYHHLGNVKLLNKNLSIGVISIDRFSADKGEIKLSALASPLLLKNKQSLINILLGDRAILNVKALFRKEQKEGLGIVLKLGNRIFFTINPAFDSYVNVDSLEKTGTIYLCLFLNNGEKIKIPFAVWVRNKKVHLLRD